MNDRRAPGPRPLVLCYHAVSPAWPAALSVTPEQLEDHLGHLASRGYRGVTFADAVSGAAGGGRQVAITFDDGFRSVVEVAKPILDRFEMPATVFVPTRFIGGGEPMAWPGIDGWLGGEHEHELEPMSWEEARALVDAGWEIGSHTVSHPRLTALSDAELAAELGDSRRRCEEELGRECASIAFPYGDHDDRVVAATGAAGYRAAGTLPADNPVPAPLAWPRIGIYHVDTPRSFRLKVSPAVRRLRRSAAWGLAMRGARAIGVRRASPGPAPRSR
jgi:peptidoglycan/xylan/chitin deacetylase (PgdA/CDA1 family)